MKNLIINLRFPLLILLVSLITNTYGQNQPTFNNDPKPNGKKWVKVNELSDEFNDNSLDTDKWRTTSSGGWIGRPPGLFETNNVWESNQNLRIKARRLPQPRTIDGEYFDHGGGYVESNYPAEPRFNDPSGPGLYFECRMWANKTFMSSTFWFNNKRSEGEGCDRRVTELDIHESVGQLTGTNFIAQRGWDRIMHSNAHSRSTSCDETPTGSSPVWNEIGRNVSEGYHIYGAWWKSPREIICYLDGKKIHTIVPKADFNLKLYMRLVVETYDWNPEPSNDIMDFSLEERTTLYDWVRTWKLEDAPSTPVVNNSTQYFLVNRATGKKVRVRDTENGSALQQVPADWNGGFTKWTIDEKDNGYFHLKNVGSKMYFRPADETNSSILEQRPTSWSGGYTQWTKVDTDNGWFFLQNRATGMYFRPLNDNDYVNIIQYPTTWGGGYTQWKLVPVTAGKDLNVSANNNLKGKFNFYPNPAIDIVNLEAANSDFNVSIYNLQGDIIKQTNVNHGTTLEVSVSDLNSGVYLINYESVNEGEITTKTLIIK